MIRAANGELELFTLSRKAIDVQQHKAEYSSTSLPVGNRSSKDDRLDLTSEWHTWCFHTVYPMDETTIHKPLQGDLIFPRSCSLLDKSVDKF